MEQAKELLINMGPQHPSTHGVLRILIKLDGETVTYAEPDIGYLHRCFEKLSEAKTYPQVITFTDRTDYLSAITNEWVYCMGVEKLLGVEIPERAEYIRVIMGELQRITSHLLWFGAFALDLGAITPFLYAWREREKIYAIFERITGGRMLYNYFRIGGVRNDIPAEWIGSPDDIGQPGHPDDKSGLTIHGFLNYMEGYAMPEYTSLITNNRIIQWRTQNIAPLSARDAIAFGASGPVLRGSGVKYDLRKNEPYSIYDRFDFDIPVGKENGDVYDRYLVRMAEIVESTKIVRQALATMPEGEVLGKVPRIIKPPAGEVYARVEGSKGEVGAYIISDGSPNPYRVKWRSPCFVHLQLLPHLAPGFKIADLVAIIGSIDIVLGEVDR